MALAVLTVFALLVFIYSGNVEVSVSLACLPRNGAGRPLDLTKRMQFDLGKSLYNALGDGLSGAAATVLQAESPRPCTQSRTTNIVTGRRYHRRL